MKYLTEFTMYFVFAAILGAFSVWPSYQSLASDRAIVSLVFSHAANRVSACRKLSQDELDELPPNMRNPLDCPRERHLIRVQLRSGDRVLYNETLSPSGIWADGKANVYQRIELRSGPHELFVGMNDSGGESGFDFSTSTAIDLSPGRNLVIRFNEQTQQFSIR